MTVDGERGGRPARPVAVRSIDGRVYAGDLYVSDGRIILKYDDGDDLPDSMRGRSDSVVLNDGRRTDVKAMSGIHDIVSLDTEDGKEFRTNIIWSNRSKISRAETVMHDGTVVSEDELLAAACGWRMKGRPRDRIIKGKTGVEVEDEMRAKRGLPSVEDEKTAGRRETLISMLERNGVKITMKTNSMSLDFNDCADPIGMQKKIILSGVLGHADVMEE